MTSRTRLASFCAGSRSFTSSSKPAESAIKLDSRASVCQEDRLREISEPDRETIMPEFKTVLYEKIAEHVLRITQNRPEVRNAQNLQLTYDLNDAFDAAAQDDAAWWRSSLPTRSLRPPAGRAARPGSPSRGDA